MATAGTKGGQGQDSGNLGKANQVSVFAPRLLLYRNVVVLIHFLAFETQMVCSLSLQFGGDCLQTNQHASPEKAPQELVPKGAN